MSRTISEQRQTEFTQHAGFLLAQLGRAVTRQYRAAFSPIGLKPRATSALLRLREALPKLSSWWKWKR